MANPIRSMGSQGLQVAALGYGCMSLSPTFYGPVGLTDAEAQAVITRAYELGVRLFNTSDLYGPYTNEMLVGKALKDVKGDVVIATKWGPMFKQGAGIVHDLTPDNARKCCEGSLERLGVEAIDLFTLRGPVDASRFSLEEVMGEVKALVQEGKVKYVGLSEVSAAEIRRAHAVMPITAVECEWSLFTRDVEADIVPVCRELGIGIMAYSPLGRGMLTGQLKDIGGLDEKDFRRFAQPRFAGDNLDKNLALVARLEALAASKGCTPAQLALAWLLAKGEDVFPIPGTKRLSCLEENMGAIKVKLSPAEVAEIEREVPADQVAGTRYPDMAHTYHGSGQAH